MLKALKSQDGMSIVELLATLVIAVIIFGAVAYIFGVGFNMYTKATDTFSAHSLALLTMQKIEAEVSYADSMQIEFTKPLAFTGANNQCLYVSNGRLAKAISNGAGGLKDQYVYQTGAYSNINCNITYKLTSATDKMVLEVTISVYKGSDISNILFSTQTDIVINNLDPSINPALYILDTTAGIGGSVIEFSTSS